MRFRNLLFGISASFGIAWMFVVVVPYFVMRGQKPIVLKEDVDGKDGIYFPKRTGRIANGAQVYAANGCYQCHTQVVRPTDAGNDLFRADWGGIKDDPERGDTRRETLSFDFEGEKFAQIGVSRIGPDLANLGRRVEARQAKSKADQAKLEEEATKAGKHIEHKATPDARQWLYLHLYDPRATAMPTERHASKCPSFRFLFETQEVQGNRSLDALSVVKDATKQVVPNDDAKALVDYLLSLKKDDTPPAALRFAPAEEKKADKKG